MEVLGIDIGSYGIKGCVVDTKKGELISEQISTPPLKDSSPHKILSQMHQVIRKQFEWSGPVGCAFPAPVSHGIVLSSRRIANEWTDVDAEQLFSDITGNRVSVINDTDATGIAEMHFGVGEHQDGLVIVLTVGTGIGSSLFIDGSLIPNTELGQIMIDGKSIEEMASYKTYKQEEELGKKNWARRLQKSMEIYEHIFHPDLFILGGQLSRKSKEVFPYIKLNTSFKPASFQNEASIVGAAMVAAVKGTRKKAFYR